MSRQALARPPAPLPRSLSSIRPRSSRRTGPPDDLRPFFSRPSSSVPPPLPTRSGHGLYDANREEAPVFRPPTGRGSRPAIFPPDWQEVTVEVRQLSSLTTGQYTSFVEDAADTEEMSAPPCSLQELAPAPVPPTGPPPIPRVPALPPAVATPPSAPPPAREPRWSTEPRFTPPLGTPRVRPPTACAPTIPAPSRGRLGRAALATVALACGVALGTVLGASLGSAAVAEPSPAPLVPVAAPPAARAERVIEVPLVVPPLPAPARNTRARGPASRTEERGPTPRARDVDIADAAPADTAPPTPEPARSAPSRQDVRAALDAIGPRLRVCAAGLPGVAELSLTVAPSGRPRGVHVGGDFGATPEGSCMARAVRQAQFPSFEGDAFGVTYPVRL